jgi:RNA polymerase sigma factor (sigma-70 family)
VGFFTKRGVPESDAENLAFECLQDVRRKSEKYQRQDGGGFNGWVFTIARRKRIDWWRRNGTTLPLDDEMLKKLTGQDAQLSKLPIDLEYDQGSPDEISQAVYDALEQLSTTDQKVIRLRFIDAHFDTAQLAAHLEIPTNVLKTQLIRALMRLETILKNDPRIKIRK